MESEQTQIRLAERCALDKTTMVVTGDELERSGLAERRPSPTDRRARIIARSRPATLDAQGSGEAGARAEAAVQARREALPIPPDAGCCRCWHGAPEARRRDFVDLLPRDAPARHRGAA